MIAFLSLLVHVVVSPFKTKARLEAEDRAAAASAETCCAGAFPRTRNLVVADRLLFVWLYRLFPAVVERP